MADVVTSQTIVDTVGTKTVMKFTNIAMVQVKHL